MKLSILNLVPVREGQDYAQSMQAMIRLAQHGETLGIARYWIAEHHNMRNLASSATALLIQHTLAHTQTLRVGSGGVMLPNHSPYIVAEQYSTLETLYPGRIDIGLGRAPSTDRPTARPPTPSAAATNRAPSRPTSPNCAATSPAATPSPPTRPED